MERFIQCLYMYIGFECCTGHFGTKITIKIKWDELQGYRCHQVKKCPYKFDL